MPFDFQKWIKGPERGQSHWDYDPRYDALPDPIKMMYTPEEFAWLGNKAKANIVELECCPDPDDFGV